MSVVDIWARRSVASSADVALSASAAESGTAAKGKVLGISGAPWKAAAVTSSPGQSPDMGAPSPQPRQNPIASAGRWGRGDVSAVCGDDVDPVAISTRGPPRPTARPQQDPQLDPQEHLQAAAEPEPARGRNESSLVTECLLRFVRDHRASSTMNDTEFTARFIELRRTHTFVEPLPTDADLLALTRKSVALTRKILEQHFPEERERLFPVVDTSPPPDRFPESLPQQQRQDQQEQQQQQQQQQPQQQQQGQQGQHSAPALYESEEIRRYWYNVRRRFPEDFMHRSDCRIPKTTTCGDGLFDCGEKHYGPNAGPNADPDLVGSLRCSPHRQEESASGGP